MADFQSLKSDLKAMFPSMDTEVVAAVLRESRNDGEGAKPYEPQMCQSSTIILPDTVGKIDDKLIVYYLPFC